MAKLRLVGWEVRPLVYTDDGENLVAVPVSAVAVPASGWDAFKNGGDKEALEGLRKQLEANDSET